MLEALGQLSSFTQQLAVNPLWTCRDQGHLHAQACKAPHADIAAAEAEAAARLCEHLLHLQRRQRAYLGRLGARLARVCALAGTLAAFGRADSNAQAPKPVSGGAGVEVSLEATLLASAFAVPPQVLAQ